MEKFFKVLKGILLTILIIGIVGLSVCYVVIPNETETFVESVMGYLNTPIGIVGGTTITASFLIKLIFTNTSFGKKTMNELKTDVSNAKELVQVSINQAKDFYDNALKEKEEQKAILSAYSVEIDNLVNQLVKVCETSPNVRINAIASEIKELQDNTKQQLDTQLTEIDNNFNEYVENQNKVVELENKVAELTDKLERLVNEYGEREESING